MLRQRLRTRGNPLAFVGRLLVVLIALALVFYGAMLLLLALKVSPATVQSISGYRSTYGTLTGIHAADVTGTVRLITAAAGLLALLVFGYLAYRELPRPYFARTYTELVCTERGDTTIAPRAIERIAEGAALGQPGVTGVAGRYGGDAVAVNVTVDRARVIADALEGVHVRVIEAIDQHGLPHMPVLVTLTGFDRKHKRELH